MIHYHGTPITPNAKLWELAGRNFCVRYGAHAQVATCHEIGQSVMLDNGAYSFWKQGTPVDWPGYYKWCEPWLHYQTTWAVIPDVIGGSEDENDRLIREWPFGQRGVPVWHMHESLDRLRLLAFFWPRLCIGSSAQYADPDSDRWARRMDEAFNALFPGGDRVETWVHMLRAMSQACKGRWPFASADSTNTAQNHHRHGSPLEIAHYWDTLQAPATWSPRAVQAELEVA